MSRLSRLVLFFSIAFAFLFIAPALFSGQLGAYPLLKVGDVIDVFTPLILLPLYWLLFRGDADDQPGRGEFVAFFVLAAFWVEGQGMHLAANSIGHLLKEAKGSDVYALTYFYDEVLGHYLWHFGIVGLAALLLYRHWRGLPSGERAGLALPIIAGVIHGLTFFIIIVEGGTALLGVPFALLVTLLGLLRGRGRLRERPGLAFLVIAFLVAALLFAGWGIYWGGLPQFSEVGIIE